MTAAARGTERFSGKRAVITGGATGIGRATALRFADEGAQVIIGDIDVEAGNALADASGGRIEFRVVDVGDVDQLREFIHDAGSEGGLDILFNNAGAGGTRAPIAEMDADDWDRTLILLLRSVTMGMRFAAPLMAARGGGAIINTASASAFGAGYGPAAYSVAKGGVLHVTQIAAVELASSGVRVNAVVPGYIATQLFTRAMPLTPERRAQAEQAVVDACAGMQPIRRAGRPEDVAAAVAFLASEDAAFITGTDIKVDGGLLAGERGGWDTSLPRRFSELSAFRNG